MADELTPYHHHVLTDQALRDVYSRLLRLLGQYEIAATFAFVMAFTLTPEERRALENVLGEDRNPNDPWLTHYWAALKAGQSQGWHVPEAFEAVAANDRHEIACHGFSHRPLGDNSISAKGAEADFECALAVAERKGVALETVVFPRNEVGHVDLLPKLGFMGYREALRRPSGRFGRALHLASEFDVRPPSQRHSSKPNGGEAVRIPPGYFLNWPFGPRKLVPDGVTIRRWRNLLRRTADEGTVAHLWLHPHNLITSARSGPLLETILGDVADLQQKGKLKVMTQTQYCQAVLSQ